MHFLQSVACGLVVDNCLLSLLKMAPSSIVRNLKAGCGRGAQGTGEVVPFERCGVGEPQRSLGGLPVGADPGTSNVIILSSCTLGWFPLIKLVWPMFTTLPVCLNSSIGRKLPSILRIQFPRTPSSFFCRRCVHLGPASHATASWWSLSLPICCSRGDRVGRAEARN